MAKKKLVSKKKKGMTQMEFAKKTVNDFKEITKAIKGKNWKK